MEGWWLLGVVLMTVLMTQRSLAWRKRIAQLKGQVLTARAREEQLEIDLMIERMRLDGIEKFLAHGQEIVYSHSVGICVRSRKEECCIPLDEAIVQGLEQKTSLRKL